MKGSKQTRVDHHQSENSPTGTPHENTPSLSTTSAFVSKKIGRSKKLSSLNASPSESPSIEEENQARPIPVEDANNLVPTEFNQLMVLPQKAHDPHDISTRARSAWRMGIYLGMVYDCSDEEAIQGLTNQIRSRRC